MRVLSRPMTHPAPAARLVTVAVAAEQLGLSQRTVYELMNSGELASIKLPPHTQQAARRIEQTEIDAFIKRNRQAAVPSAS